MLDSCRTSEVQLNPITPEPNFRNLTELQAKLQVSAEAMHLEHSNHHRRQEFIRWLAKLEATSRRQLASRS
jgi:hypothetical protein